MGSKVADVLPESLAILHPWQLLEEVRMLAIKLGFVVLQVLVKRLIGAASHLIHLTDSADDVNENPIHVAIDDALGWIAVTCLGHVLLERSHALI